MSGHYAKDTTVSIEKSRMEVERVLTKYGCSAFVSGWDPTGAMVQFEYRGRNLLIRVPFPDKPKESWSSRTNAQNEKKVEQSKRQRWRVLLLLVKAQLEAVESGLVKFEEAFLPWMLLADGKTVAEKMIPALPPVKEPLKLTAGGHR